MMMPTLALSASFGRFKAITTPALTPSKLPEARISAGQKSLPRMPSATLRISLWKNAAANPLSSSERRTVGTMSCAS